MEDTYLKITQDTGTLFSRKRESRLQSFAWIPARTTLGRADGTILSIVSTILRGWSKCERVG